MNSQLIAGPVAFQTLAPVWDALVDRAMTATPFQRLAYQKAWWTHLGPGELFTIVIHDEDEQPSAIACFYLLDETLYFNGCVEETDYLDLIAGEAQAAESWDSVFDVLDSPSFPAWQSMSLCNIPEMSPSRKILLELASKHGYGIHSEVQDVCPVIRLPDSFDGYLMDLDKKQRHEVRRKLRRASAAGAEVYEVTNGDNLNEAVEEFLRLLQLSMTEKEDWLNPGRRAVFHEVAEEALRTGMLQLLFLRRDSQNAAALFNFDYKGRIWVYNSGFDIIEFGHLSPGVVLTARSIEMAIERGKIAFDFLRGDEEYKYRFGAEDTTVHRLQVSRQ